MTEEDPVSAFQEWKKKWNKKYDSDDEEKIRYGDFEKNFREEIEYNPSPPKPLPLWDVLSIYADRPKEEHFGYIRLDRTGNSDEGIPKGVTIAYCFPIKLKDGTKSLQWFSSLKEGHKIQSEADAIFKQQSTVLPVKRPSSDDDKVDTKEEEDQLDDDATVKRPKIGCSGAAKIKDVAMTLENEGS